MPEIKLLLFDIGNVLVRFDHRIIARQLSSLSGLSAESIVHDFIRSRLGEAYDEGKISSGEFHERISEILRIKIDFQDFARLWNEIFFEMPGMEGILKSLDARYPLLAISDTNPLHFDYLLAGFPIFRYFTSFVLSYRVGCRKPGRAIFEEVLRRGKAQAEETFYVDDRGEILQEAERLGFKTHRFISSAELESEMKVLGLL